MANAAESMFVIMGWNFPAAVKEHVAQISGLWVDTISRSRVSLPSWRGSE